MMIYVWRAKMRTCYSDVTYDELLSVSSETRIHSCESIAYGTHIRCSNA